VEKYYRAGQATDDNMALACCMLDNKVYRHTHTLFECSTYWFSTATVVAQMCLSVTLYIRCQSC
jgi:hypothetical protein